jgi:hypothetical protein
MITTLCLVDGYMIIDGSKYRSIVGIEIASTHPFWPLKASSGLCGLVRAIMNTPSANNNRDKRHTVQFE